MTPRHMKQCRVSACERLVGNHGAKGLCSAHYKRMRAGTDLNKPIQDRGAGWSHSDGYLYLGSRGYHRQVVERSLGRKLKPSEVVHHIDGDKRNNDLSNLRIMSRGDHARLHNTGKTNEQRKAEKALYGVCLTPEMGAPT